MEGRAGGERTRARATELNTPERVLELGAQVIRAAAELGDGVGVRVDALAERLVPLQQVHRALLAARLVLVREDQVLLIDPALGLARVEREPRAPLGRVEPTLARADCAAQLAQPVHQPVDGFEDFVRALEVGHHEVAALAGHLHDARLVVIDLEPQRLQHASVAHVRTQITRGLASSHASESRQRLTSSYD